MVSDLIKETPIKRISTEDEPIRAASENESFKSMCNIQIDNRVERENKLEDNVKKAYEIIFKEFCPSQMQNRIKEHPKYDIILNNTLKIMDEIFQSIHKPILATYPYMPST